MARLLKAGIKILVLAAVVGGGYYAYTVVWAVEEDAATPLPGAVTEVRDLEVSIAATGVLQPIRIVEVKSKASGEILEMPVEMGDRLEQGDLIAQVDTEILSQELKQAEADHESVQVRLEIAQKQFERARSLHEQDLISENDLESSRQTYTSAEGEALRAEAELQLVRERLEDATVSAPISGTVIAKQVEQGTVITSSTSNVSGGTVLVQMADLRELEIRTLVDEIDIGRARPGLPVLSTVEAYPDREFEGELIKIEPQAVVQESVTTFPVLSRIANENGLLLPGMNADVRIIVAHKEDVLTVPNEAVRTLEEAEETVRLLGLRPVEAPDPGSRRERGRASGSTAGSRPAGTPVAASRGNTGSRDEAAAGYPAPDADVEPDPSSPGEVRRQEAVFVRGPDGRPEPRFIVTGMRDWERTEVFSGLEAGDELVIVPGVSLLEEQAELRQRFSGGGVPGLGGGGRRWR